MADSWVKLHRKFQRHPFWTKKRKFSEAEAWLDLIMQANWGESELLIDHQTITLPRGSLMTSEPILSARWGRSRTWVRSFLFLLTDQKMCRKISDNKKTTIEILNYDLYQGLEDAVENKKTADDTAEKHQKDMRKTVGNTQSKKNKNTKKNEEEEIYIGELFHCTATAREKFVQEFGQKCFDYYVISFNGYLKAKSYSSPIAAIRNWRQQAEQEHKGFYANVTNIGQPRQRGLSGSDLALAQTLFVMGGEEK